MRRDPPEAVNAAIVSISKRLPLCKPTWTPHLTVNLLSSALTFSDESTS